MRSVSSTSMIFGRRTTRAYKLYSANQLYVMSVFINSVLHADSIQSLYNSERRLCVCIHTQESHTYSITNIKSSVAVVCMIFCRLEWCNWSQQVCNMCALGHIQQKMCCSMSKNKKIMIFFFETIMFIRPFLFDNFLWKHNQKINKFALKFTTPNTINLIVKTENVTDFAVHSSSVKLIM